MSLDHLPNKIAALPATEQRMVEAFVDQLLTAGGIGATWSLAPFERARRLLEGLHGKVDISSSVRELRDSD